MLVSIQSPYATSYYIPSRIVLQLSHNIGHIIAFDKGVPLVNALILDNLYEYHHKSYCWKLYSLDYIFVADSVGLASTSLT